MSMEVQRSFVHDIRTAGKGGQFAKGGGRVPAAAGGAVPAANGPRKGGLTPSEAQAHPEHTDRKPVPVGKKATITIDHGDSRLEKVTVEGVSSVSRGQRVVVDNYGRFALAKVTSVDRQGRVTASGKDFSGAVKPDALIGAVV